VKDRYVEWKLDLSLFLTCYSAVVLALQGSFSSGKGC
jgi:hypothetical protein